MKLFSYNFEFQEIQNLTITSNSIFDNDTNHMWYIGFCLITKWIRQWNKAEKDISLRLLNCKTKIERGPSIHRGSRYFKIRVVSIQYSGNVRISLLYKCNWMSRPQSFVQTLFSRFTQKPLFPHFLSVFIFESVFVIGVCLHTVVSNTSWQYTNAGFL